MQALEKILEEINQEKLKHWDSSERLDTDKLIGWCFDKCIDIIRNHMNDGWISVEKDLPKNGSDVWVVLESTYGTGYRTYSNARYLYFENCGESHWCDNHYGYLEWDKYSDGNGGSSQYKVIAWQSIAPYRPERSEGE